jgi:hypothetical protein
MPVVATAFKMASVEGAEVSSRIVTRPFNMSQANPSSPARTGPTAFFGIATSSAQSTPLKPKIRPSRDECIAGPSGSASLLAHGVCP